MKSRSILIVVLLLTLTVNVSAAEYVNTNYSYLGNYGHLEFAAGTYLWLTGETSLLYGIPIFTDTTPICGVNYSKVLIPVDSDITGTEVWSNDTHKILKTEDGGKVVLKDGSVSSTHYHFIGFYNGFLIGGSGSRRHILDQQGDGIPNTDFTGDYPKSIFGLNIGEHPYVGPDSDNPGNFNIISAKHNKWF